MNFISHLEDCAVTLYAIMSETERDEFLQQSFYSLTPSRWQQVILEHELLMPKESELYRRFRRAGIFNTDDMTAFVLQTLYLMARSV